MADPQRSDDLERFRAFVAGELSGPEREAVEAELDQSSEARALLGVLARESERTNGPRRNKDPYIGALLGDRYRIKSVLGKGGMGVVYEADHILLGRAVAVKLLHSEYADHPEVRRRFENEARAVVAIEHPNIVRALDVGRAPDGSPFLVFERLRGRDLEHHLREHGRLPLAEAAQLVVTLCDALSAAHTRGIVHRDLKPGNIFLEEPGPVPKVLDFGISKLGQTMGGVHTRTGAMMGTPAYMAPEQLRDASKVDPRADVFALGVMFFRMVAGELPHDANSWEGWLAAREAGPPKLQQPASLPASLPATLDAVLARAMAFDPADRIVSMHALREAVAPFAQAPRKTTSVRPLPPGEVRLITALVTDAPRELVEPWVERASGRFIDEVAVFGEGSWSTDVLSLALDVAMKIAESNHRVVLGSARLDRDALDGNVRLTFARALRHGPGVFVAAEMRAMLPGATFRDVEPDLLRLVPDEPTRPPEFGRLLGRDAECARMQEALERCFEDREAAALLIQGAPGSGKSRLLHELRRLGRSFSPRVLEASGRTEALHTRATTEFDVLRRLLEQLPNLRPKGADDTLARYVGLLMGDGGGVDATQPDVRLMADRIHLAGLDVLAQAAEQGPLLLIIDDAQWVPPVTWNLFERLLTRAANRRLLIVAATRDDDTPLGGENVSRVRLRGLRKADVGRLAEHIRGTALEGDALERLHKLTGGNPFFVEQVLRAPAEAGGLPLPPNVEAAIVARLDALPELERELIKRAAVFGAPFDAGDVAALGVDAPGDALTMLRKKELLRLHFEGEAEMFAIGSALVARTAYRMLPQDTLRFLHERAAERLASPDRLVADRLVSKPDAEAIAFHYERADNELAGVWSERAARAAAGRADAAKVIEFGNRALARNAASYASLMALSDAHEHFAQFEEQSTVLDAAFDAATNPTERVRARLASAVNLHRRGRLPEALALFADAEQVPDVDPSVRADVLGKFAVALAYSGKADDAAVKLNEAERIVMTRAPEKRAAAAVWRGQLAAIRGDLSDRRNAYWAAVELFEEARDLRKRAGAAVNLGDVYNRLGGYVEAERALRQAILDCDAVGATHASAYAHLNLAYALLQLERWDEVDEVLDAASQLAPQDERLGFALELYRGRAQLAHGVPVEAVKLAERAVTAGYKMIATLAWALASRAATEPEQALAFSEKAMALLDELGTIEEDEAEVLLAHARAQEAAGLGDAARDTRARGRAALMAVARRIGDPMWREHFLTDVRAHRELLGT